MDFRLYARVIWRFKLIMLAGLVLALALAFFSMVKVTRHGVSYRQTELWSSTTRVGVTQKGFPWGRLFAQAATVQGVVPSATEQKAAKEDIPVADPGRFNGLAILYSQLATSDEVRLLIRRDHGPVGQILATPLVQGDNQQQLPIIDITAISTSPTNAMRLSMIGAKALDTYITSQQDANKVPASDRAILQLLLTPRQAHLFQPRPKTMPIIIFGVVMLAAFALAFLLENLRPRVGSAGAPAERELQDATHRLSA
jgi:hypothetical protein